MSDDISKRPSLLIVSDTAVWQKGEIHLAYEPVVRELESIGDLFSNVTWVGFDYGKIDRPVSARSINGLSVKYILLKRMGGTTFWRKMEIFLFLPFLFIKLFNLIKSHDVIHSRGPSVPAFLSIVISFLIKGKTFWHKYAGNWIENDSPFMYSLQRKLLKKAHRSVVTINGDFSNPRHVLNFINPCLYTRDFEATRDSIRTKDFQGQIRICFVGNLARFKGVDLLLDAIRLLDNSANLIKEVVIVGDGELRQELEIKARTLSVLVIFKGYLKRQEIDAVYKASHLNVLPSSSEGFPKVIAEGGIFGCCPVVSNVSSIGQIIRDRENGMLLPEITPVAIMNSIKLYISLAETEKIKLAKNIRSTSLKFSYEDFRDRIKNEILVANDNR